MKIVVLDGELANPGDLSWALVESLGALTVLSGTKPQQAVQKIGDAEAVILNKVPLPRQVLQACPKLRYVGLLSTGYNHVDVAAAKEFGITVSNVPNYSTAGVAQHTLALLLEICNQVGYNNQKVQEGAWDFARWTAWDRPLTELCGKTLGIVGFGNIGRAFGAAAKALGMRVVAHGGTPTPEGRAIGEYIGLSALLAQADVVSLHCPLLPETRHIINESSLDKMRRGAILLNTSRGALVQEQALANALAAGKLAAAGLDVVEEEPLREASPLWRAKNCFITPHIAWAARETRARLLDVVYQNLLAFINGAPANVVSI